MNNFKEILKLFISWRLLILLAVLIFTPLTNSFKVFANFDGVRFLDIAREGYGTPNTYYSYLLFPFFPLLIRLFSPLLGYFSSGLFVSHLFALGSLYVFQLLASLDYSKKTVRTSLILLLSFPSAFFLVSVYSESLFLFLCLLSVYLTRKKYFLFSGLVAALASYTRLAGLFLWLILIIEYYQENKHQIKAFLKPTTLYLLLPPLGSLFYLNYLQLNASNIERFLLSIPSKFVFLHQVIFRYLKMLILVDHSSSLFLVVLTESLVGFFALYLLIVSFRRLRFSYWLYLFLSFFVPTLWGDFVSLPRYLLVVFPFFFFLGDWYERQHPYFQKIYFLVSIALLSVNLGLFVSGIFVG